MIRMLLALLLVLGLAVPAQAHKLKLFASVEGAGVKGYAFFVGGGRAQDSPFVATDAAGTEIARGRTDADGRFAFQVPGVAATGVTVTVDTQEGHMASVTLAADRFGSAATTTSAASAGPVSRPAQDREVGALVEAAVQRQIEPLLERIEQMDSRLRLTDALSGVFLIFGLAGMALWARGRRA